VAVKAASRWHPTPVSGQFNPWKLPGEGFTPNLVMPMAANPAMGEYPRRSINRLRERLETDEIHPEDANALRRFSDQLDILGKAKLADYTHEKYLMRLVNIASTFGDGTLAAALDDEDAAREIVAWINREQHGSPETNKDYRGALRQFGRHATEGDEISDSIAWVPGGYPNNYDPAPDPGEMLHWEEHILPMVEVARNPRDAALVTLAWDLGARSGELHSLTVGSVVEHDYGLQITVGGKQGQRSVVVSSAVSYLRRWLDVHPGGASDDPLWSNLRKADRISSNRMRDILKALADRAEIDRPVTPTNFRKSSASYLASEGVPQAHIEDHHGWERGSEIAARYVSVFGDANDREIARAHGVEVPEDDETEPVAERECPQCGRSTPRHEDYCVWCGAAVDPAAASRADAAVDDLTDAIRDAAGDDPERLDDLVDALDAFRSEPRLLDAES
jgi:integrase